ncbi:MAG TPA: type 1 glutamine amidotransferase [Euzebyales bacterium]|nr:type 1 glutamine amidotransferase [Euzebyales bacterium]
MRRALFISHEADVAPGYIGDAAAARGFRVERCDVWRDGAAGVLPPPEDYDLVVPLGSAAAAYDDDVPWLAGELDLLRRADRAGVPVFGICFGAQALARALGGTVAPADRPEVGWYTIDSAAPELVAPGPWLEWHFDTLTPPEGAAVLARSPSGVQAYQHGRNLGVQFHPEVSPGILAAWIAGDGGRLRDLGDDTAALLHETRRRAARAGAAAHVLFDRVLARLDLA